MPSNNAPLSNKIGGYREELKKWKWYLQSFLNLCTSAFGSRCTPQRTPSGIPYFFALITHTSLKLHDLILECPHPQIKGTTVDTFIPSLARKPVVIEFKYDREIPSGKSVPRPQNAGELFNDIYRFSKFAMGSEPDRLVIYYTDNVMAKYFRRPRNGYFQFFDLPQGEVMQIDHHYIETKPSTFKNSIKGIPQVDLICLWIENLLNDHELRIYRVMPLSHG